MSKVINCYMYPIYIETLCISPTTTLSLSELRSNREEDDLQTPQISIAGATP